MNVRCNKKHSSCQKSCAPWLLIRHESHKNGNPNSAIEVHELRDFRATSISRAVHGLLKTRRQHNFCPRSVPVLFRWRKVTSHVLKTWWGHWMPQTLRFDWWLPWKPSPSKGKWRGLFLMKNWSQDQAVLFLSKALYQGTFIHSALRCLGWDPEREPVVPEVQAPRCALRRKPRVA